MENRNGLLVDFRVEPADGYAERRAALAMLDERLPGSRRITLGGDKGYDTRDFVAVLPRAQRHSARRAEPERARRLRARRAHRAPSRLRASAKGSASGSRRSSAG